jgi:hypothetical protein
MIVEGSMTGYVIAVRKKFTQNGDAMTRLWLISLPLILLSVVGCASKLQPQKPSQAVAEKIPEEQPRKPAIPTFTYRPGG